MTPKIERLPTEVARQILPRMFIPSRAGLAFVWESMSIAQHCFYDAALERWPDWTHAQFPQGAHEVSFSMLDLQGYFDGFIVSEELAWWGATSRQVYVTLMQMASLRNRTCHFPPRSDAHYLWMQKQRKKTGTLTGADEMRDVIHGLVAAAGPFAPDSAGWYCETMAPACNLASVLNDDRAMQALDDLYDPIENRAWAMLRAVEGIAALRDDRKLYGKDRYRRREMDRSRMRDTVRALPEELHVPLRIFFETVGLQDEGWPELIRRAALVWRETTA